MIPCPSCRRHHRAEEATCPFCGHSARRKLGTRVAQTATACFSAMVLMACYGAPPGGWDDTWDTGPVPQDMDQDGYDDTEDCDDSDATINPGADEVCDDEVDNDCDELTDDEDDDCEPR